MAREVKRLTQLALDKLGPGLHHDGAGLYLRVARKGAKSWVFRYMLAGKAREMGLGAYRQGGEITIGLAEARQRAQDARRLLADRLDPIEARKRQRAQQRLEDAKALTFKDAAERYIAANKAAWKNGKHRGQWTATLATYAYPIFGALPVAAIDTALVMKVLEPIWTEKPETAGRLRGRMERVLSWAKVRGYREGQNSAQWRGHLDQLLPARAKVRKVKHHAALPYGDMGEFMARLRAEPSTAARALEFTILTAARTGEVIGARWSEIDFAGKTWTVPAERMKGGKEHRVPLSAPALAILRAMERDRRGDFIFFGIRADRGLSNMAMLALLKRMKRADLTTHGFRSSFRDWAAEHTSYPREVAEMALAHALPSAVEAAYRRGDLLAKRQQIMEAWAGYCASVQKREAQGNVATLRKAG